jgi:hypothetical protein
MSDTTCETACKSKRMSMKMSESRSKSENESTSMRKGESESKSEIESKKESEKGSEKETGIIFSPLSQEMLNALPFAVARVPHTISTWLHISDSGTFLKLKENVLLA